MIPASFVYAVPLMLIWVVLSDQYNPVGFALGYAFGLGTLLLAHGPGQRIPLLRVPGRVIALLHYTLLMFWDIFLSGVDVATRALNPRLPIKPGIIRVDTQDENGNWLISAFSAHSITITPGELVVDFEWGDETLMYVHCLDVDRSAPNLEQNQARRLRLLRRIMDQ